MKKITAVLAVFALLAASIPVVAGDFPKGSPAFKTNYAEALAAAKSEGKPVVLVFSAVWCPPCQAMKKEVYPSREVRAYHDKFVWAYLDVDEEANGKTAATYKVQGIPHIQFLSPDGQPVDQQIGASAPKDFAKTLAGVLKKVAPKT